MTNSDQSTYCALYLVCIALVDQELLALGGEVHLRRILRHEGVEVGIVLARAGSGLAPLRSQNPAKTLCLLAARPGKVDVVLVM